MKKILFAFATALLVSTCSPLFAQTPEQMAPPPVLSIVREDIKPGQMPAHNRHSATFAQIFSKLKSPNYRIALVPVTGSENEVIYITPFGSFAQFEKTQQDTEKILGSAGGATRTELNRLEKEAPDLHAAMRDLLTVYRPDMSFDPGVNIGQMRYFSITTVRIRPGHDAEYADYIKSLVKVVDKAKPDNYHIACFQVVSGAPAGTYMFFRPMKSLAELDQNVGMKVRAAMSEDMRKTADKTSSDAVVFTETSTYAYEARMSYVPADMVAQDPSFWNPKPAPAPRPKRPAQKKVAAPANPQ